MKIIVYFSNHIKYCWSIMLKRLVLLFLSITVFSLTQPSSADITINELIELYPSAQDLNMLNAAVIGMGVGEKHALAYENHQNIFLKTICDFDQEKLNKLKN